MMDRKWRIAIRGRKSIRDITALFETDQLDRTILSDGMFGTSMRTLPS